ncbi:marine proteobacterial sortase target protein [Labrys neptuniae]|uniref:marine proteobacterial sortase target protein n=1 Tax=Labrys neptuniae TaxID=376174 RepID=UPI00288F7909|nr:marine proteobacterial sortase target protein [Labrys neptuniae]MDT3376120.1 marine proteobacterial sortase target protein [Labrys neptuniae]
MNQAVAGRQTGRRRHPHSGIARAALIALAERFLMVVLVLATFLIFVVGAYAAPRITVDDVKAGSLLMRTDDPGSYVEAVRTATDVQLNVSGPTIRATLTQMFHNPSKSWVEGIYVFPLPDGAAVDTMKMVIGQRVVVADIKEKQQAKLVYERAKAEGKKAALVEQQRPNMFMNSIANIGPGDTVVIQIEYQEPVRQADNTFSLRVPLVVAPRFSPSGIGAGSAQTVTFQDKSGWGAVTPAPASSQVPQAPVLDPRENAPVNPVQIRIDLDAGFALGDVKSAFHPIKITDKGPQARHIELASGSVPADRDFELTWSAQPSQTPGVGLFREKVGSDDYLIAYVTPPSLRSAQADQRPRDVTFVIDNSGSMGGTSIEQARASLAYALGRLTPSDRFNVIRFDDTFTNLFGGTLAATPENIARAQDYVSRLQANGGTMMVAPMLEALKDDHADEKGFLRQVVFITDGGIDNEQELFDAIASHRGRSRVFMVGIGSAPNSYLMTRAAELGGGAFMQIGSVEQVQERMKQLVDKLESPAMTNVDVAISAGLADVTPRILPDLYHGETLVLAAKVKQLAGNVEVRGLIDGKGWSISLPVAGAAEGAGISKLWARRKIDDTEVAQTLRQISREDADKRILALALDHHLVTRLTSLVAVDKTPVRPRGVRLSRSDVPLNLPAGWDFDKVFGIKGETVADREQRQALLDLDGRKVQTIGASRAISLPQTATDAELRLIIGGLLLAGGLGFGLLTRRRRAVA